jgi:hypothetical protein
MAGHLYVILEVDHSKIKDFSKKPSYEKVPRVPPVKKGIRST